MKGLSVYIALDSLFWYYVALYVTFYEFLSFSQALCLCSFYVFIIISDILSPITSSGKHVSQNCLKPQLLVYMYV